VTLDEFIDELYIHQLLGNHPHVVKFVGACTMEPNLCILLELMPQKSVEELLVKGNKYNKEEDFSIVAQMVSDASAGLLHMHSEGVIHRDVAARNFLVNAQNRVTICDFGLSRQLKKVLPDGKTVIGRTGSLMGPIKWMAPELLKEEVDLVEKIRYQSYNEKTDVYMFGVFLWEVFARSEPYPGISDTKAAHYIASEGGSPDLSQMKCPEGYRDLVASCLSRDPSARPNMIQVAATLRELLEDIKAKQEKSTKFVGDELNVPSMAKRSPSSSIGGGDIPIIDGIDGVPATGYTKLEIIKDKDTSSENSEPEPNPNVFLHLPGQLDRLDRLDSLTTVLSSTPPETTPTQGHSTHVTNYLALV
jgi:serine/threonine protein kinase